MTVRAQPSVPQISKSNSENSLVSVPLNERIDSIDTLRGVALLGVLLVNLVTEFRVSVFQQFLPSDTPSWNLNGLIETFVSFALNFKAFSLFSILFGVGLAMQLERLSNSNHPYYFLTRRLIVLLGFGILHLVFIWNGDILTEYAIAGLLALPLLGFPRWTQLTTSILLFALYAVLPMLPPLVPWPSTEILIDHVAQANQVYSIGTHLEILKFNIRELALILPLHISVFPRTLALILLGAYIWRSGVLQQALIYRRQLASFAVICIVAGIALTYESRLDVFGSWGVAGLLLQALTPVVFAFGYGSLVIWLAQLNGSQGVLAPFAAVGRMAFTNYILQSVIFGFVFFGYGLGQFGRMAAWPAFLLGVVVYLLQAILSAAWLRRFRFGPIEWLWRVLMYGRMLPIRAAE